jgi:hypothetical protein
MFLSMPILKSNVIFYMFFNISFETQNRDRNTTVEKNTPYLVKVVAQEQKGLNINKEKLFEDIAKNKPYTRKIIRGTKSKLPKPPKIDPYIINVDTSRKTLQYDTTPDDIKEGRELLDEVERESQLMKKLQEKEAENEKEQEQADDVEDSKKTLEKGNLDTNENLKSRKRRIVNGLAKKMKNHNKHTMEDLGEQKS